MLASASLPNVKTLSAISIPSSATPFNVILLLPTVNMTFEPLIAVLVKVPDVSCNESSLLNPIIRSSPSPFAYCTRFDSSFK